MSLCCLVSVRHGSEHWCPQFTLQSANHQLCPCARCGESLVFETHSSGGRVVEQSAMTHRNSRVLMGMLQCVKACVCALVSTLPYKYRQSAIKVTIHSSCYEQQTAHTPRIYHHTGHSLLHDYEYDHLVASAQAVASITSELTRLKAAPCRRQ